MQFTLFELSTLLRFKAKNYIYTFKTKSNNNNNNNNNTRLRMTNEPRL